MSKVKDETRSNEGTLDSIHKEMEKIHYIVQDLYYMANSFARVGNTCISTQLSELAGSLSKTPDVVQKGLHNILDIGYNHAAVMHGNMMDILLDPKKYQKVTGSRVKRRYLNRGIYKIS